MTPEERQLLGGLFQRVASTGATPRDAEAEAFINDAMRAQPHAPYVLTQTVLVQQQALEAASQRIQQLEAQAQGQGAPHEETSFLGSLGRSLFGGGNPPPPPPRNNYDASAYQRQPGYAPPPQQGYAPPPQQGYPPSAGPWGAPQAGPSGGGFLQSALTTAAGVAGGVALAEGLSGLFGGRSSGLGLGGLGGGAGLGGLGGGRETVINNYYDDPAGQHAEDVLQDQDQDQDDAQDAADDSGGFSDDSGSSDT